MSTTSPPDKWTRSRDPATVRIAAWSARHRWRIFAQLIGFTTKGVSNPYWVVGFDANPPEFKNTPSGLNRALMQYYFLLCRSPFFRGAFWMLICFGLVYLLSARPADGR